MKTLMLKKTSRKNRKGFSLVELIVVLVIMAILTAALVPSLIGYIRQARQSTAKDEAASAVQAAQTIASSAYASGNNTYTSNTSSVNSVQFEEINGTFSSQNNANYITAATFLAEVDGTINSITVTDGVVTGLQYATRGGSVVTFDSTASELYTVSG